VKFSAFRLSETDRSCLAANALCCSFERFFVEADIGLLANGYILLTASLSKIYEEIYLSRLFEVSQPQKESPPHSGSRCKY
jgi:hypothetical protein